MTKQEFIEWLSVEMRTDIEIGHRIDSVIQQAIAEHEAKKWHKYLDKIPEFGEEYLWLCDNGYMFSSKWYGSIVIPGANVIAWQELPAPYEPKDE